MTSREFDGLLMLIFSISVIALSFGLSFLFVFIYITFIAIKTGCNDIKTDHIVVLGKKLENNSPDNDYQQRLDRTLSIVSFATSSKVYILGGITGGESISEARAGQNYLEENNIQTSDIYLEEKSRDTLENMKQLKTCSTITDGHISLITNRYHLARASIMAQGCGFVVEQCAAEDVYTHGLIGTLALLIEAFYLHWYLTGRTYAKLTHNKRMLSRIQ